jgi:hypothetical protein
MQDAEALQEERRQEVVRAQEALRVAARDTYLSPAPTSPNPFPPHPSPPESVNLQPQFPNSDTFAA